MNNPMETIAVFEAPEELAEAVDEAKAAGAEIVDICSPVPLSELEESISRRPSPVRWFTLIGCVTGAAFGLWLQIYSVLSWPIPVGGKPIVSMSAFVIIAFELTILVGGLATFGGFLLTSRLPRFDGGMYHPKCSRNEFALVLRHESNDCEILRVLLASKGAQEIKQFEQKKDLS